MIAPLGTDDGLTYMLKAAVLRRHLSDSQRAIIFGRWATANPAPEGAAAHSNYGTLSTLRPAARSLPTRYTVAI